MTGIARYAAAIAALGFGVWPAPALAHPHVWVTARTEIVHDTQGRVAAFRHHWTFDEVFSAFAAQGLDKDGDGKFTREELAGLAKVNITSLKEFDFFTFAKATDKPVELNEPEEGYYLSHENGKLTLHFVLPLRRALDARKVAFKFSVYDPTYYVDFAYAKEAPVRLAQNAPKGCRVEMQQPPPLAINEQKLADLSEAFFNELGAGSNFGAQFAPDVAIACPSS